MIMAIAVPIIFTNVKNLPKSSQAAFEALLLTVMVYMLGCLILALLYRRISIKAELKDPHWVFHDHEAVERELYKATAWQFKKKTIWLSLIRYGQPLFFIDGVVCLFAAVIFFIAKATQ